MTDIVRNLHPEERMEKIRQMMELRNGGGGGGSSMLEERVKRLEVDLAEIRTDLKSIRDRLSRMEGEISRLPGYPGLFVISGTLVAIVGLMVRFL